MNGFKMFHNYCLNVIDVAKKEVKRKTQNAKMLNGIVSLRIPLLLSSFDRLRSHWWAWAAVGPSFHPQSPYRKSFYFYTLSQDPSITDCKLQRVKVSTQCSNKLHSHSNCISSAGQSSRWPWISTAVVGVKYAFTIANASMEKLHIWYVGGLLTEAPWSVWDIYRGVLMPVTTVNAMSIKEGLGLLCSLLPRCLIRICTHSDLAD